MVIAVEFEAVKDTFSDGELLESKPFPLHRYVFGDAEIYLIESGAGESYAAAATQHLIDAYKPESIINFGVAGALNERLSTESICVVKEIIDYQFDTSAVDNCEVSRHIEFPTVELITDECLRDVAISSIKGIKEVRCASGNAFVSDKEKKEELSNLYQADICEMEAAAIYLTCHKNGIPSLFVKAISDTLFGGAEEYKENSLKVAKTFSSLLKTLVK